LWKCYEEERIVACGAHTYSQKQTIAQQHQIFEEYFSGAEAYFQVIDLKESFFCLGFGQIVETRILPCRAGCQEQLVHKVIHIRCG